MAHALQNSHWNNAEWTRIFPIQYDALLLLSASLLLCWKSFNSLCILSYFMPIFASLVTNISCFQAVCYSKRYLERPCHIYRSCNHPLSQCARCCMVFLWFRLRNLCLSRLFSLNQTCWNPMRSGHYSSNRIDRSMRASSTLVRIKILASFAWVPSRNLIFYQESGFGFLMPHQHVPFRELYVLQ